MTTNNGLSGVEICPVTLLDIPEIAALHARVFGPGRFSRTAYRIREDAPRVSRYCQQALVAGRLVAAVSFTEIEVGTKTDALLLGPLAVAPEFASQGLGRILITAGLDKAKQHGIAVVFLVGDQSYYARLGFGGVPAGQIKLPGPVDPSRLLVWQAEPDAIKGYSGMMTAG